MMPISSSPNIRLTRTSLRPPPRSLEESILEHPPTSELNQQYYLSNSDFYIHQKTLFSDRNVRSCFFLIFSKLKMFFFYEKLVDKNMMKIISFQFYKVFFLLSIYILRALRTQDLK